MATKKAYCDVYFCSNMISKARESAWACGFAWATTLNKLGTVEEPQQQVSDCILGRASLSPCLGRSGQENMPHP